MSLRATEFVERANEEIRELKSKTVEEVREEALEEVEQSDPPIDAVPEGTWREVSRTLAGSIPESKGRDNLDLLEKQGIKLMLSTDQKRVRPVIGERLLEAADPTISEESKAGLTAAPELVHFYSKGIDDDQDGDVTRNGELTLHSLMTVAKGDPREGRIRAQNYYLAIKSREDRIIGDLNPEEVSYREQGQLRAAMAEAENELVDGQNLDLDSEEIGRTEDMVPNYLGGDLDVMAYLRDVNRKKTGALFGLLGRITEIVGDIEDGTASEWGYVAGQAFQIQDDVIDLKQGRFSDLRSGNYSVPIYMAEKHLHTYEGKEELGEEFTSILRARENTEDELERAYEIMKEHTPALEAAEARAEYLADQSKSYLNQADWDDETQIDIIEYFTDALTYEREK